MSIGKKSVSVLLAVLMILTVMLVGVVPGTVKTQELRRRHAVRLELLLRGIRHRL